MRTVHEDFEKDFKCIADKCPMTCCKGWQIVVDENSLNRYSEYSGNVPNKINAFIDFEEGTLVQKKDLSCAFLNKNGLCDLQLADGEDMLCDTCRLYPRHVEEYEDLREWSVSLSCPEAARMYVERTVPASEVVTDDDSEDPLSDEFEDFDYFTFDKLLQARDVVYEIILDEHFSFAEKIGFIMDMSERLQAEYDKEDVIGMLDVIKSFDPKTAKTFDFLKHLPVLKTLERLDDGWNEYLKYLNPEAQIHENESCIDGVSFKRYELIMDNLMHYFVYTYFLGAVYNGMIFAYTAMCMFSVAVIDYMARSKKASLMRNLSLKEFEEIVYRYSREIEHSDDNIDALLCYFDKLV